MYASPAFIITLRNRIKRTFGLGIPPTQLALSITVGIIAGVFPFFFMPTVLVLLAAFALRLNLGVMVVFNYATWPLQIILFVPYIHLGNNIFGGNNADTSLNNLYHTFRADFFGALHNMFSVIANATGAWALSSIPAALILYYLLHYIARAVYARQAKEKPATLPPSSEVF